MKRICIDEYVTSLKYQHRQSEVMLLRGKLS